MKVLINKEHGWSQYKDRETCVWFKGHGIKKNFSLLIDWISKFNKYQNLSEVKHSYICRFINTLSGHFSIIIKMPIGVIMIVDKVNSISLYYAKCKNEIIVGNNAKTIFNKYSGKFKDVNKKSFLEMFMSGYTIGRKTLFHNLYRLQAGEYACIDEKDIKINHCYTYSPWKYPEVALDNIEGKFEHSILQPMQQLINDAGDRAIVVPLSAGKDSRLVVSALKYLGAKKIFCFAYGSESAFESKISRAVANRLGIDWIHVPLTISGQKDYFRSIEFREYSNNLDTLSSITFLQDVYVIRYLLSNKLIPYDAIIVNGNTGDFLSGGHILPVFKDKNYCDKELLIRTAWSQYLDKHYSLWGVLRNQKNDEYLIEESTKIMEERGISLSLESECLFGYFETLEYLQRQSKYVVNMQRSYDFYELEWRMPLWSETYMNFWESVRLNDKFNQSFYIRILKKLNWGEVWKDIPINNYSNQINPYWIRPLRNTSKLWSVVDIIFKRN